MKERIRKFHKQNSGSTLIIVLTVVAFLSILAVVVTSAAAANYKMKMMNRQSQKVFYNSENAVDEIYAALGKITMQAFDDAYNEEMANVVRHTNIGGNDVTFTLSSESYNTDMRENFIYKLVSELNLWRGATVPERKDVSADAVGIYGGIDYNSTRDKAETDKFVELLNSFLEEQDGLVVKSVGTISAKIENSSLKGVSLKYYSVTFTDCVVEYLNENDYYSTLAFDCNLAMPDMFVEFATESKTGLDAYKDYTIIGNTGIVINDGSNATLTGSAYAGKLRGLLVGTGSAFDITGNEINIIVGGDVNVKGGTLNVSNVNGGSLWCTGIITETAEDTGAGSNVTINSNTYVKDDLQIDGDGDRVSVAGNYYGYSYVGNNAQEGNHNNSSAIILNGKNAVLNLNNITSLLISGSAYIDYKNGQTTYATGEGLALKGSQEIYLVPSYLMNKANPVVGDTSDVTIDMSGFFGKSFLKESEPYTERVVERGNDTITYYYLNFKDGNAANEYVEALLDNGAWAKLTANLDEATLSAYEKSRKYVQDVINANLDSLSSIVTTNNVGNVLAGANVVETISLDGSVEPSLMTSGDLSNDQYFKDLAQQYAYDYRALTTILRTVNIGENLNLDDYAENNVFANIISVAKFNALVEDGTFMMKDPENEDVILYAINNENSTLIIGNTGDFANFSKGIVVASGNVIVEKDFAGTIIAGGSIFIEGDGVDISHDLGTTSVRDILDRGSNDNYAGDLSDFAGIFGGNGGYAGDDSRALSNLTYKDFAEFLNWRKSYEED